MTLRFTEENAPELMHVSLKGGMLCEFLQLVKDSGDPEALEISKDAKMLTFPEVQEMFFINQQIANALEDRLGSNAAYQFGLDAHDMESLLQKVTGGNSDQIMGLFALCLAIQEHKEDKFIANSEAELKTIADEIKIIRAAPDYSPAVVFDTVVAFVNSIVVSELNLGRVKARKSPVTELMEQVLYGEEYPRTREKKGIYGMLKHAIATFNDFDPNTNVGKERIRHVCNNMLADQWDTVGKKTREID